jgi:hypothetical protein
MTSLMAEGAFRKEAPVGAIKDYGFCLTSAFSPGAFIGSVI